MNRFVFSTLAAVAATMIAASASAAGDPLQRGTTFSSGSDAGWLYQRSVPGTMWVDTAHGHGAPAIRHTQMFAQGSMMFQQRASWLARPAGWAVR